EASRRRRRDGRRSGRPLDPERGGPGRPADVGPGARHDRGGARLRAARDRHRGRLRRPRSPRPSCRRGSARRCGSARGRVGRGRLVARHGPRQGADRRVARPAGRRRDGGALERGADRRRGRRRRRVLRLRGPDEGHRREPAGPAVGAHGADGRSRAGRGGAHRHHRLRLPGPVLRRGAALPAPSRGHDPAVLCVADRHDPAHDGARPGPAGAAAALGRVRAAERARVPGDARRSVRGVRRRLAL
ncbi:MAG: hypothetical protein AVDCRST_MAG79-1899, partial [uncultured Thermoleophilia bacterium]